MNYPLYKKINPLLLHGTVAAVLYVLLYLFGYIHFLPGKETLMHWDAEWYYSIAKKGYVFLEGKQNNLAFFPAFPFLWKILHLNALGISIFNGLLFGFSLFLLGELFKLNRKEFLLLLSAPSLVFCVLPYTESLFFFAGVLIIKGLHENKNILSATGIVLAGITKPVSILLIPVIIIIAVKKNISPKTAIVLSLSSILSLLAVVFIQWKQTDTLFHFWGVQQSWNKAWQLPSFPLTTYGGTLIWILDGSALIASVTALAFAVQMVRGKINSLTANTSALFSSALLVFITIVVLVYSITDSEGHTSLTSLNRYIFATPFFMIFQLSVIRNQDRHFRTIALIISLSVPVLFFQYSRTPLIIMVMTAMAVYSYLPHLMNHRNLGIIIWGVIYSINTVLQVLLFYYYLGGIWIG